MLENRNEKDIVKFFGQEDLKQKQESFRSLLKIFSVLKVLKRQMEAIRGHTEEESNFFQHLKCLPRKKLKPSRFFEKKEGSDSPETAKQHYEKMCIAAFEKNIECLENTSVQSKWT